MSSLCLALTGCACRAYCDVILVKQMSCFGIHDGSHSVSKISDNQYEKRTADSRSLIIGIISCLGIILVRRIINFSLEDANLYAFPSPKLSVSLEIENIKRLVLLLRFNPAELATDVDSSSSTIGKANPPCLSKECRAIIANDWMRTEEKWMLIVLSVTYFVASVGELAPRSSLLQQVDHGMLQWLLLHWLLLKHFYLLFQGLIHSWQFLLSPVKRSHSASVGHVLGLPSSKPGRVDQGLLIFVRSVLSVSTVVAPVPKAGISF